MVLDRSAGAPKNAGGRRLPKLVWVKPRPRRARDGPRRRESRADRRKIWQTSSTRGDAAGLAGHRQGGPAKISPILTLPPRIDMAIRQTDVLDYARQQTTVPGIRVLGELYHCSTRESPYPRTARDQIDRQSGQNQKVKVDLRRCRNGRSIDYGQRRGVLTLHIPAVGGDKTTTKEGRSTKLRRAGGRGSPPWIRAVNRAASSAA